MKKQFTSKLHLNKETLRNLSDRDLKSAIGGATFHCVETGLSYCVQSSDRGELYLLRQQLQHRQPALLLLTPNTRGGRVRTRPPHLENASMWQSIASADTRRECWSTIERDRRRARRSIWRAATATLDDVTGGYAGAALFYAYLHAASGNDGAADRAFEALERSTSALAERQLLPALYSGFVGVGWVVTHLMRDLFEGDPGRGRRDRRRAAPTPDERRRRVDVRIDLRPGRIRDVSRRAPSRSRSGRVARPRPRSARRVARRVGRVAHGPRLDVAVAARADAARLLQPRRRARDPRRDRIPRRRQSRRRQRSASGAFRRRCRAMDAGPEVGSPFRVALSGVHSGRR